MPFLLRKFNFNILLCLSRERKRDDITFLSSDAMPVGYAAPENMEFIFKGKLDVKQVEFPADEIFFSGTQRKWR